MSDTELQLSTTHIRRIPISESRDIHLTLFSKLYALVLVGKRLELQRLIGDFETFAIWEVSAATSSTRFALKVYEEESANFTEERGKKTTREIVTWKHALARETPHVPEMYVIAGRHTGPHTLKKKILFCHVAKFTDRK